MLTVCHRVLFAMVLLIALGVTTVEMVRIIKLEKADEVSGPMVHVGAGL